MNTAKVFQNGGSQAVRLPRDCQFNGVEVGIRKLGDVVLLFPKDKAWEIFEASLHEFSDDFMATRDQGGAAETRQSI